MGSCEGLGAGFGLLIYLHEQTPLDLSDKARADYNDFNKKMYRHGPGVSTRFYGLRLISRFIDYDARRNSDAHDRPT